jgi:F-type H+-transporting ATPase subunit a
MKIAFIPIELLGTITKPVSLMIRLFANMTAGHVVVMTLISLAMTLKAQFGAPAATGMAFAFTLFISLIELLVAFLQAFIFTMLSSLFIGMATAEHDHEHDHGHEHKHSH